MGLVLGRAHAICPLCGGRYSLEVDTCRGCRSRDRDGVARGLVRLWYVTYSERGATYHPPSSLNREARRS
jgi:hypothetical protein